MACRAPLPVNVLSRLLHELRHLRGLGRDGERARVDAPRIEQVADEPAHVLGLRGDDAVELARLGRVEPDVVEQRRRRALDGGERLAQLVADEPQELGAQAFNLVERGEVLHGHHHRRDGAVLAMNGRRVDEHPHTPPVGHREHHLLGAQRLSRAELPGDGELAQGNLAPVGAAKGDDFQKLLGRVAGRAKPLHDAPRLAVERHRPPARRVEHHHPDRGGLDQGLEVGPRAALGAVGARVRDGGGGLRGEQHQDLLVLVDELAVALLPGEEEVPDVLIVVAHRGREQGVRPHQAGVDAERAHEPRQVGQAQRSREAPQVLEHPQPLGPVEDQEVLLGGEARGDDVAGLARCVDGGDDTVARAGEGAGALDDLAEHGVEVEARVDARDGRAQGGDALAQRGVLAPQVVGLHRGSLLPNRHLSRTGGASESRSIPPPAASEWVKFQNLNQNDSKAANFHTPTLQKKVYRKMEIEAVRPRLSSRASKLPVWWRVHADEGEEPRRGRRTSAPGWAMYRAGFSGHGDKCLLKCLHGERRWARIRR